MGRREAKCPQCVGNKFTLAEVRPSGSPASFMHVTFCHSKKREEKAGLGFNAPLVSPYFLSAITHLFFT